MCTDIENKPKRGLAKIGFIDNFNTYLGELKSLTGEYVNTCALESFVDDQIKNKAQVYLNAELEVLSKEQTAHIDGKYVLVNTGLRTRDTQLPIWGGFCTSENGNYAGVDLGTYDSLIREWKIENSNAKFVNLEDYTYICDYEHITKVLNLRMNLTYYKEQWIPILRDEFMKACTEDRLGVYKYKNKGIAYFKLSLIDKAGNTMWIKMQKNTHISNRHQWFGIFLVSEEELKEEVYSISNYCLGTMIFEKNASFDGLKRLVADVASQALKENWDLNDGNEKNYHVLRNYLENTLLHLELEDIKCQVENKKKVIRKNGKAFFNTGLLNKGLEDLYIVGEDKNITYKAALLGELTYNVIANPRVYEKTNSMIKQAFPSNDELPKMAAYFTGQEPPNFNASLEVRPNAKHICHDNLDRILPKRIYDKIKEDADAMENWTKKIQMNFENAVNQSKKLAARSFRLAVPQFSPETEKIQFLLPICLKFSDTDDEVFVSDDYSLPCCVLVLASEGEIYEGKTVLTLSMAYNNARLIERPGVTWLDKITQ